MGHGRGYAALALASALIAGPGWAAGTSGLPPGLQTKATDVGLALAGADGRPLYRLDLDGYAARRKDLGRLVKARCADVCSTMWRPVAPPAGYAPAGDWGVVERPGAGPQLTYKKAPLYSFIGKSLEEAASTPIAPSYFSSYAAKPSELRDGVPVSTIYWHEALYQPPAPDVASPAGVSLHWEKAAYVFADASGKSLYAPAAGQACASGCAEMKPLAAPLAAQPVGAWRPVQDQGGQRVWAYRGRIVYQAADQQPAAGAGWQALEAR